MLSKLWDDVGRRSLRQRGDMNDMVAKKDVVVTTIRIERETKEQADRVFRSLGLNFNSGVDLYLRKVVRDQAIPFDLSLKETEQQ